MIEMFIVVTRPLYDSPGVNHVSAAAQSVNTSKMTIAPTRGYPACGAIG